MTDDMQKFTPRSVFILSLLLICAASVAILFWLIYQNNAFVGGPYSSLLVVSGFALVFATVAIGYNAAFLQFTRLQNFGLVCGVALFSLSLYYIYVAVWEITNSPSIDRSLIHFFYVAVALILLTALSQFHRLFRFVIILAVLLLVSSLLTSRIFLNADILNAMPWLSRFNDVGFWNLISILVFVLSCVIAFLASNLLLEKFKQRTE